MVFYGGVLHLQSLRVIWAQIRKLEHSMLDFDEPRLTVLKMNRLDLDRDPAASS